MASASLTRSVSMFGGGGSRGGDHHAAGYLSRQQNADKIVSAVTDPDDDDDEDDDPALDGSRGDGVSGLFGGAWENPEGVERIEGAFSALTPSMWPENTEHKSKEGGDEEVEHDEFGFRLDVEDGPEDSSNALVSAPFEEENEETAAKRLKWIAQLEFAQTSEDHIARTDKLRELILEGIPHALRPQVWMRLAGAHRKKEESEVTYKQIVRASSNDHLMTSRQIEKDLLRTLPSNICFNTEKAVGIPRLRRILRGVAWLYPDIGYCQGMGMIVAIFLLLLEEEDSFWITCAVVEDLLPASYFSSSLVGVQADQLVLRGLIASTLPEIDSKLQEHDIEISLITLNWFLTCYSSVMHIKMIIRLWDLLLFDGSKVLFQTALGMFKVREQEIISADNSAAIFNVLSTLPAKLFDVDGLFKAMDHVAGTVVTDVIIEDNRRRQVAFLLSEQGSWRTGDIAAVARGNARVRLTKRTMKRSKSVVDLLLFPMKSGHGSTDYDIKSKNIRHTEILINLRDVILRVANYFQVADPATFSEVNLIADYTVEGHARDNEIFLAISKRKRRRARAVIDFERRDDDELGFRKNDIVTIISERDEHCWVGELNGHQGWFPAKLVEPLDERTKQYSFAGDDSVSASVTDLVRGSLCPAVKRVLEHGLRKSPLLLGPCHPWLFIEEAAAKEVEKDFRSVYSRLVLCKTFRLNEDGKVLSPEELLYRCVEAVNFTHNPVHAQMDVKLRSLICLGLNEQVLHLWLESLASNEDVVRKWFHPWSYMSSPGWVQVKCELRLLAQFSFNLTCDWELKPHLQEGAAKESSPRKKKSSASTTASVTVDQAKPLQDGVKDMLVKHHLFSWDL